MTRIDYTALTAPVTRQEIAEFRRSSVDKIASSTFVLSKVVLIAASVAGLVSLSVLLSLYRLLFGDGSTVFVIISTMLVAAGVFTAFRLSVGSAGWARLLRLSRFAEANGLSLAANGLVPDYPGSIFTIGSRRRVSERLSRVASPAIDFGNLNYTTGSGKSRTTHRWGYLAITLDRRLPHMVLDAKSNNLFGSNLPTKFSRSQILSLEGDFDRYFTLYCPREYERDALYVFTPDLMAQLIDEAAQFDVEIIDNWMFLYCARPFNLVDSTTLSRIFRIIDTVGDRTFDRTERYADDRAADNLSLPASAEILGARMSTNSVAARGRRLQRGVPVFGIVIAVIGIAVWLLNILPALARF